MLGAEMIEHFSRTRLYIYVVCTVYTVYINLYKDCLVRGGGGSIVPAQEAKYVESWPNMTSGWAGWSRFDIPVDRSGGVHSQLICTSSILGSSTCQPY